MTEIKTKPQTDSQKVLKHFIDFHTSKPSHQDRLQQIGTEQELRDIIAESGCHLECALIPLEQATRPPKILVDSGVWTNGIAWRTLHCPGGPLVLQAICKTVNFAVWVPAC